MVLEVGLQCWGNGCFNNDSVSTVGFKSVLRTSQRNKLVSSYHKTISLSSLLLLNLSICCVSFLCVIIRLVNRERGVELRVLPFVQAILSQILPRALDWPQ